jgi:thioredoxin-dependent peroxiredoxin
MRLASLVRPMLVGAAASLAIPLGAQQTTPPAAPPPLATGPAIGVMAPDFQFTGITRYGMLGAAKKLSDYRGTTVVLAFFPKARTKG